MEIKILASGSDGNCYRVSDGKTTVLLDAGISVKRIRTGCDFNLSGISGCLITHLHGDHTKGVKGLLDTAVPVYMPEREIEAMKLPKHHRLHPLEKDLRTINLEDDSGTHYKVLDLGTLQILPFPTEHDTPEPVGYLIFSTVTRERLLYFTDTFYINVRFANLNYIIGECNYDSETMWEKVNSKQTPAIRAKRLFSTHMSLETFLNFLRSLTHPEAIRQIYICHMSDDHGNEAKIREAVQRQTGAEVYVC